ncbi:similar to methylase [Lachnospiraceae bacterium KM106-2]|nr:similar to methylase [Lachnospiraceae bacterium KM106-2]
MNEIENWYDHEYEEWERLERHRIEFEITKRYLNEYITGKSANIIDIGGGPGRYSIFLAEQGHEVSLVDLSQHNVEVAGRKAKERGVCLKGCEKGDALNLQKYNDGEFDVVLLMGPLYHLTKELDRKAALSEALRVLKPGGVIFAAFISNYAPIQDCLSYLEFNDEVSEILHYLDDGRNEDGAGFTTAYFTSVKEAKELMREAGLDELAFVGVENVIGCKEREIAQLPEEEFAKWLEICYQLGQDPQVYGTSQHFLYIGRK